MSLITQEDEMYRGAINTRTKRQPVVPVLPFIRTYSLSCTILVFDEGFMTLRADYWNDMKAVLLHNVRHGGPGAFLVERNAQYADPAELFKSPNQELTPQLIRSEPKFAQLPLVGTDDVFQAWIASDSLFSRNGPYAMAILGRSNEWRTSLLAGKVHIIVGNVTDAANLLRTVLAEKVLQIKVG